MENGFRKLVQPQFARRNSFKVVSQAVNLQMAKCGIDFMEELLHLIPQLEKEAASGMRGGRYLQLLSVPFLGSPIFYAAPAQYGSDLKDMPVVGEAVLAEPLRACAPLMNKDQIRGRIAVVERSDCMFQQKTRHAQQAGAIAVVVIDHVVGTTASARPSFAMAEDRNSLDDVGIPSVFLYFVEGQQLMRAISRHRTLVVRLGAEPVVPNSLMEVFFATGKSVDVDGNMVCPISEGAFVLVDQHTPSVIFNFRFESVDQSSEPTVHQEVVERHVTFLQDAVTFDHATQRPIFFNLMRTAAYGALGLNVKVCIHRAVFFRE
ncbi:hypothetical protein Y032_0958g3213 [Ancylostoma ceylanicum]|uniref:PA domain-containing protein n=1 Tax=Ancylostoma ceylanicum TaxID=53326 RepID=A0A016W7U5_9BILA|nr:hypothetical protein Y032_0958g3213 [Ancylostoma ceylanicum]